MFKDPKEEKDYEELAQALWYAERVCAPDEYQYRQNRLSNCIAKFLLKDYQKYLSEKEDKDEL